MTIEACAGEDVRRGILAEAERCADILNAWIDATDWMPRVHSAASVRAYYCDVVFAMREVWVIGRPVAGFLALDPAQSCVTALYVGSPGGGRDRRLLDRVKRGRDRLTLWTFQASTRARAFYAREAFVEARMTPGDNEEGLPDVLLRWERPG